MRPVKVRPLLLSVGITAAAGFLGGLLAQLVASFVTIQYDSVFGYVYSDSKLELILNPIFSKF